MKKLKEFWKRITRPYWRWRVGKALKILRNIDNMMTRAGFGRTKKRQFWRDFVKRSTFRTQIFKEIEDLNK